MCVGISTTAQQMLLRGRLETLDFLVFNGNGFTDTHGPTGLRTEMNLTANSVNPEPTSLAIAGLVAGWHRQRSLTVKASTT